MDKSCFNCKRQYNCGALQEGYSEYIATECEDYVESHLINYDSSSS